MRASVLAPMSHARAERLLSISGEDEQQIDRKFLPPWQGKLHVRFWIFANELPRITDASGALASRFVLVTLRNSFLGREDLQLTEKLLTELPGILNAALGGWTGCGTAAILLFQNPRSMPCSNLKI